MEFLLNANIKILFSIKNNTAPQYAAHANP